MTTLNTGRTIGARHRHVTSATSRSYGTLFRLPQYSARFLHMINRDVHLIIRRARRNRSRTKRAVIEYTLADTDTYLEGSNWLIFLLDDTKSQPDLYCLKAATSGGEPLIAVVASWTSHVHFIGSSSSRCTVSMLSARQVRVLSLHRWNNVDLVFIHTCYIVVQK